MSGTDSGSASALQLWKQPSWELEGREAVQPARSVTSPVACGGDEVNAAVHPGVWDPLLPVDVDFLLQVGFVLLTDELRDGLPAGRKPVIQNMQQQLNICYSTLCLYSAQ